MLTVIDEFTRRCLAIVVARKLRSDDVLHSLRRAPQPYLFAAHGPPEHIRSDNVLRQEVDCPERQQISFR